MRATTTTTATTTERTPLLYRGGGGCGERMRRASVPDHQQQHGNDDSPARTTAAFNSTTAGASCVNGGGDVNTAPPSYLYDDCNSKRDRRGFLFGHSMKSLFHRLRLLFRGSGSSSPSSSSSGGSGGGGGNTSSLLNDKHMYEDPYNDESWKCTCGTDENDGVWLNYRDQVGTLMSSLVWVLFLYSAVTVLLLAENNSNNSGGRNRHKFVAALYCTVCALALASHAKTSLTDPGTVPTSALPPTVLNNNHGEPNADDVDDEYHTMCSICKTYKPPKAHHCRICNRCVCGMDHHCPWMNNCIGSGNLKHFILFLAYTWIACVTALLMFGVNYFFCSSSDCEFDPIQVQLVRVMTWLCVGSLVFTSSMIVSVFYGVMTGIGTVDRLKRKANNTWHDSTDTPTRLVDIFGIGPYWSWFVPADPIFNDFDQVMGYSTLQRLLRKEQILSKLNNSNNNKNTNNNNIDDVAAAAIQQRIDDDNNGDNNNGGVGDGSSWKRRSSLLEGLAPYEPVDV